MVSETLFRALDPLPPTTKTNIQGKHIKNELGWPELPPKIMNMFFVPRAIGPTLRIQTSLFPSTPPLKEPVAQQSHKLFASLHPH